MTSRGSRLAGLALVAVSLAGLGAACSKDSNDTKSASAQVCDSRSAFSDAVQTVANDVSSGNLGDARNNLTAVTTTFGNLVDSIKKLTDQQRQALQPQIDKIQADVQQFANLNGRGDLQGAIDTTRTDVESALSSVKTDLNC